MKQLNEFDEMLKTRYVRLYGNADYSSKIQNQHKKMLMILLLIIFVFLTAIIKDMVTARTEYSNIEFNKKGEIVGIQRPGAGEDSYSFTARVKIKSDNGERENEYYITIEPAGEVTSVQNETDKIIIPEEEKTDAELKRLISKLNDDTTLTDVVLPQSLETGEKLVWLKADNKEPVMYFFIMLIALYLVYRNRFYAINKEEMAAKESVIKELPEFINKLVLLINAGVILNSAFLKIVDDCDKKKVDSSYFYMRMVQIGQMVRETNASFYKEMYLFARNSGVKEMMRISSIMMDNISKGDDLSEKLKRENEMLWFARKQQAEEKGKLAETKLTLPLMILLGVLIMVTIAPALMEI